MNLLEKVGSWATIIGCFLAIPLFIFAIISLNQASKSLEHSMLTTDTSMLSNMIMTDKYYYSGSQLIPELTQRAKDDFTTIHKVIIGLFSESVQGNSIYNSDFSGIDLFIRGKITSVKKATFCECNFGDSNMQDVIFIANNWRDCMITNSNFFRCEIVGGSWRGIYGSNATFDGHAQIKHTVLGNWDVKNVTFSNRVFRRVNFSESKFDSCDFSNCKFSNCYLKSEFINCNFSGSDFFNCDFNNSKLTKSNFNESNLNKSSFVGAILTGAKFKNSHIDVDHPQRKILEKLGAKIKKMK